VRKSKPPPNRPLRPAARVRIRRLTPGDGALAGAALRRFQGRAAGVAKLREYLGGASNLFLLAEIRGIPVGFLRAHVLERPDRIEGQLFIYDIEVAPRYRRRGIGRRLVARALQFARSELLFEAFVLTSRGNRAAAALYEATGASLEDPEALLFVYPLSGGEPGP